MITGIDIIDVLLSYADGLGSFCRGVFDMLQYKLWTMSDGSDLTLGLLIFGFGFPAFVIVIIGKWVTDFIT